MSGWTDFMKGKMGPAMKKFGGNHKKAINHLSKQWAKSPKNPKNKKKKR